MSAKAEIHQQNSNQGFGIPYQSAREIRQSFVDFFKKKEHLHIPSSPVVPHDDPTLLFNNAGMNQFKSVLLGENPKGLKRAANSQKCIRVSGKHNDLDVVGRDTYHHTFFEMLGNWSFGDYYKREAIRWAWELLTEVWKLPKNRLFATVYTTDDEAIEIWKQETDIAHNRIMRFEKENFWEMGEVGPCGPCSEIHFDMGDEASREATYSDPILGVNGSNARYIEIWNNVFMQSERLSDGTLKKLKSQNVDTGMGFERVCSIIQGSGSNYETDVFTPIIQKIAALSGVEYNRNESGTPHRVIADHLRAVSFAVADGALPGNEGRGYVLRRLLRRASRFAREMGQKEAFIYKIVPILAETMGEAFPEIKQREAYVAQVIQSEEERFLKTVDGGLERFRKLVADLKIKGVKEIPGNEIFTLYDTYGFPVDLTGVLAEEQGYTLDMDGYEKSMTEQRVRARGAAKFDSSSASDEGWVLLKPSSETTFVGYESLTAKCECARFKLTGKEEGKEILVVLSTTPFYAEGGGQVGDTGMLNSANLKLQVLDTVKVLDMWVHKCKVIDGNPSAENMALLEASVDAHLRCETLRHHSATHLLQAALRQVIGTHVEQQGSKVSPEGLRFDFTHFQAPTEQQLHEIECLVNEKIQENIPVDSTEESQEKARQRGAMALFGEKYGDRVRVVQMGEFSLELCGGTHAKSTGQIGLFKLLSESSVASGVRRIEAICGKAALSLVQQNFNTLGTISSQLKIKSGQEAEKVIELLDRLRATEKDLEKLQAEKSLLKAKALLSGNQIDKFPAYVIEIQKNSLDKESFAKLLDAMPTVVDSGLAILAYVLDDTLSIAAFVSKDLQSKIKAGDLIKELAPVVDGKGGGRPDRAQAGSKSPEKSPELILAATSTIRRIFSI